MQIRLSKVMAINKRTLKSILRLVIHSLAQTELIF